VIGGGTQEEEEEGYLFMAKRFQVSAVSSLAGIKGGID
jgi:hypothetical protein